MIKFFAMSAVVLSALATFGAAAISPVSTAGATSNRCEVTAVGERSSAFSVKNNTASVKFTVTGTDGCKAEVSVNSFYAPSMNGLPYSKQTLYERNTRTVTKGTYTMSAKLPVKSTPKKGCFYQVDLTYGTFNRTPVLAYGHGKLDCSTAQPEKKDVEVCDLTTKQRVTVKEDYNKNRYTNDLTKCTETPAVPVTPTTTTPTPAAETPAVEEEDTPEELPQTGPLHTAVQVMGVSSLVASAGYYLQSRRIRA